MEQFDLPSAFEAFADARKVGFLKVKAAKEGGKKVAGCFCAGKKVPLRRCAGCGIADLPYLPDRRPRHPGYLQRTRRTPSVAGNRLCHR